MILPDTEQTQLNNEVTRKKRVKTRRQPSAIVTQSYAFIDSMQKSPTGTKMIHNQDDHLDCH